ncbi:hypothetical protein FIC_00563 [Flavobacteriaceae bacterium 3519-10]|jgi:hypothetical protein|nr:hypothetical protein FIC_00563 [Flavobacteriaceae bacterium 3519-10]
MKKTLLLGILVSMGVCRAQVGVGTNVNTFDDSEILRIVSANKGVLLPNVSIPDLHSAAPVSAPANSLIVYNTNNMTGKGFYYWQNSKWNPILDTTNIYKYLGIVRSESAVSTAGVNDASTISGVSYTLGEAPSAHDWQLIPGLAKTISIYSLQNTVSISGSGVAQVNTVSGGNTFMSYSIGLFVDSKLKSVRNFIITGKKNCLYNDFNVYFNVEMDTTGNHLIELRETLRVNQTSSQSITFGAKHASCSNLSPLMDKSIMNIQISERP